MNRCLGQKYNKMAPRIQLEGFRYTSVIISIVYLINFAFLNNSIQQ
jgi:hypothetical protein